MGFIVCTHVQMLQNFPLPPTFQHAFLTVQPENQKVYSPALLGKLRCSVSFGIDAANYFSLSCFTGCGVILPEVVAKRTEA